MTKELGELNARLEEIGREIFGEGATLRAVDPRSLLLRKKNARYFKKEVFQQLVANLRDDARLSSVPLCRDREGRLEVLSGNHRVKAAIQAGLTRIVVMVILGDMDEERLIAVQLSHNALVGQDDPQVLAELFAAIDDVESKLYAGLSSDVLGEIEAVRLVTFATPAIATKSMTFLFTEEELSRVEAALEEIRKYQSSSVIYVSPGVTFEAFFARLQEIKTKCEVKNGSVAVLKMLELTRQAMEAGL